jgi:hypothetical protein
MLVTVSAPVPSRPASQRRRMPVHSQTRTSSHTHVRTLARVRLHVLHHVFGFLNPAASRTHEAQPAGGGHPSHAAGITVSRRRASKPGQRTHLSLPIGSHR